MELGNIPFKTIKYGCFSLYINQFNTLRAPVQFKINWNRLFVVKLKERNIFSFISGDAITKCVRRTCSILTPIRKENWTNDHTRITIFKIVFLVVIFFVDVETRNAQNNYMYDVNQEKH